MNSVLTMLTAPDDDDDHDTKWQRMAEKVLQELPEDEEDLIPQLAIIPVGANSNITFQENNGDPESPKTPVQESLESPKPTTMKSSRKRKAKKNAAKADEDEDATMEKIIMASTQVIKKRKTLSDKDKREILAEFDDDANDSDYGLDVGEGVEDIELENLPRRKSSRMVKSTLRFSLAGETSEEEDADDPSKVVTLTPANDKSAPEREQNKTTPEGRKVSAKSPPSSVRKGRTIMKCGECSFKCYIKSKMDDHVLNNHGTTDGKATEDLSKRETKSLAPVQNVAETEAKFKIRLVNGRPKYFCHHCDFETYLAKRANVHFEDLHEEKKLDVGEESIEEIGKEEVSAGNKKMDESRGAVSPATVTANSPSAKAYEARKTDDVDIKEDDPKAAKADEGKTEQRFKTIITKKGRAKYQCIKCEFKTFMPKKIQRHIDTAHNEEESIDGTVAGEEVAAPKEEVADDNAKEMALETEAVNQNEEQPMEEGGDVEPEVLTKETTNGRSKYQCPKCNFEAFYIKRVKQHMELKHLPPGKGDQNSSYLKCEICDFIADNTIQRRLHMARSHNCTTRVTDRRRQNVSNHEIKGREIFIPPTPKINPKVDIVINCLMCSERCKSRFALLEHYNEKHAQEIKEAHKNQSEVKLLGKKKKKPKLYECPLCKYSCRHIDRFDQHVKVHERKHGARLEDLMAPPTATSHTETKGEDSLPAKAENESQIARPETKPKRKYTKRGTKAAKKAKKKKKSSVFNCKMCPFECDGMVGLVNHFNSSHPDALKAK